MKRFFSFITVLVLLINVFLIVAVADKETVTMYTEDGRTLEVEKPYVEAHENVGWFEGPAVKMYSADGRILTVKESKAGLYESLGWYTEQVTLMYAQDGRTLYVKDSYVDEHENVGWFKGPVVKMYSPDGRSITVKDSLVEAHENVGWYTEPVVTMYSLDGRTTIIKKSQIEAYKKVDWYTEPVVKMYSVDGRTLIVNKEYEEAHEKVGWYDEPVVIMYSSDGRTKPVKKSEVEINKKVGWYEESELEEIKKIERLVIPATVNYTVDAYAYSSLKNYITTVEAGTKVEYMNPDNHNSMKAAKIRLPSGRICWVPMASVSISRKNYTIKDVLTNAEREAFVNKNGYKSKTDYLIWVNKQRQTLTLFKGSAGNWKAVYVFPVATGTNTTPTPTVVCEYKYKTRWVTEEYICDPVMALYDGYAIHNQPVGHNGYVLDHTMGNPASAGCIRMLLKDVEKLYETTPVGTTVVLY